MFFFAVALVDAIKSEYYTDIYIPCKVSSMNGYKEMDHCNACGIGRNVAGSIYSCFICEDGYDLVYGDNKTYYYCEKANSTPLPPPTATPKPTATPLPPPTATPIPPPLPDNCPPCVCDTALKSSTDQPTTTPSTTPDNSQMMLIMFIMTTIMFFMVSYIFCKEWKPIVCKCRRSQEYNALQLTPPPSPPPPEQPQSVLPRFITTETRRSSSSTSEFSE
ncbi:hypothetical protein TRFO_10168 [Tritrichomonas foetus]|uniref:Uncharacterized protein n=1 Tax=Tritrichomonas foetus TaxID=1144522 RepID=A0A1J4JAL5_9EUKA|nr:hypothetical protein TRFO_10168 [Tritrichomonas foetus]|eukprot:OHS96214.1 hypothetical protein TRFO_10168 [Tritrichomonas foetus]